MSESEQTTEHLNDLSGSLTIPAQEAEEYRFINHVHEIFPVHFKVLTKGVTPPKKGTLDSAGYDLCAAEDISIDAHRTGLVKLGFSTAMPGNIHGRIESRSGMALKGYVVLTGVIDADYRGEWGVILHNLTDEKVHIAEGDRVAQCVFRPTVAVAFQPASELSESSRGAGGFGSTGR